MHKTRILVTGATGFIGSHVSRLLAQTGRMPRLMFRRPHRAALIAPLDAELVCADIDSRRGRRRDRKLRDRWDQYMFGPDLLVAPVWKSGQRSREV